MGSTAGVNEEMARLAPTEATEMRPSAGDERSWPSARRAWWTVTVLTLAYILAYVDRHVMSVLIPSIKADLGLTDTEISLIVGLAFSFFFAIGGLPLGLLADRARRTWVVTGGVIAWSVMSALCGAAHSFWALFAARSAVGVGEAALAPSALSLISDSFPPQKRVRPVAVFMLGGTIGIGVALGAGGVLLERLPAMLPEALTSIEPWRLLFFTLGAVGIVMALPTALLTEPVRREQSAGGSITWAALWRYLTGEGRGLWPLFVGTALLLLLNFGYIAWLPTMLMRVHGWTLVDAGVAVGMAGMGAGLAGMILAGALCEWWQRRGRADAIQRAAITFAAAGLIPLLATPLMPSGGGVVLVAFPALLCTVGVSMLPQLATQIVVPNQLRGRVLAVYLLLVSGLSAGLGPTLVAALTDHAFANEQRLHLAMASAGLLTAPLALITFVRGLPLFRSLAQKAP